MLTETVELVRLLRPRAALICNIPGLDDAPHLRVVQRTIGSLTKDGYCAADFASINAANFGVPQIRYRPFWYVHRTGSCLRWPERTHYDPDEIHPTLPGIEPLRPWVTCMEALGHLSETELGRYVRLRKRNQNGLQHGSVRERPARTVGTSNLSDGNVLLTMPGPSIKGKRNPSTRGPQSGRVGDPMRPSAAIDTDRILPPGHHPESGSIMSQGNAVVLSEKAGAILQGFPESWVFAGSSKRARWEQIGQAVPIAVAEAVARRVLVQLGSK
jgi:site-specific DNA-cytosine methylase